MRGMPHALDLRLIPARAGKTGVAPVGGARNAAHPRACGENPKCAATFTTSPGSSPRVRGKRRHRRRDARNSGLIPARAGKTRSSPAIPAPRRAHPRACGENGSRYRGGRRGAGSSPRVRGKRPRPIRARKPARLIPARAGKTEENTLGTRCPRAHPRACGENISPLRRAAVIVGSSPRVRGKRADRCAGLARLGLIPARAGKTSSPLGAISPRRAHPRACGENMRGMKLLRFQVGSSPRVRGKPVEVGRHCL